MTILIWRLTYSMCIFGWQLRRHLNLARDLQMSRFISLCSLGMTVLWLVRWQLYQLCIRWECVEGIYANLVHPIDGSEINENAHFKVVSSGKFPPVRQKSVNNRRGRDTKEVLTHFSWLYEGHLIHKNRQNRFNCALYALQQLYVICTHFKIFKTSKSVERNRSAFWEIRLSAVLLRVRWEDRYQSYVCI